MRYALSQERLKSLVEYNPDTGDFIWIAKAARRTKIGSIAGGKNPDGYLLTQIDGIKYFNHILAHLYMEGCFPPEDKQTDHINRIRDDNRWANLRRVSKIENMLNAKWPVGKSGITNIHHDRGKWVVSIKRKYYGTYNTIEEAQAALEEVKK